MSCWCWPGVTQAAHAAAAGRARAAVEQLRADGHAVRFLDGVLMPTDEVAFYRFEARSHQEVDTASMLAGLPAGRILEYIATPGSPDGDSP